MILPSKNGLTQVVSALCVSALCVSALCVSALCVSALCVREARVAQAVSALCLSPLKPSLVSVFHVREYSLLISPVLRGFFSGYSGFPLSLKSTPLG